MFASRISSRIHEASPAPHRSAPFLVVPPSAVAVLVPSIRAPYAAPCRVTRRECALLLASATRFEPGAGGSNSSRRASRFAGLRLLARMTLITESRAHRTTSSIDPAISVGLVRAALDGAAVRSR